MVTSVFNVENLMQATQENAFDTEYALVPEFSYTAMVDSFKVRQQKDSVMLDVFWTVDGDQPTPTGESLKQITGMPKNKVKQGLFLDITDQGTLDAGKGRNVELGRLRTSLGQNIPGQIWGLNMLKGGVARIMVGHRPYTDGSGKVASEVKGVAKAG